MKPIYRGKQSWLQGLDGSDNRLLSHAFCVDEVQHAAQIQILWLHRVLLAVSCPSGKGCAEACRQGFRWAERVTKWGSILPAHARGEEIPAALHLCVSSPPFFVCLHCKLHQEENLFVQCQYKTQHVRLCILSPAPLCFLSLCVLVLF